MLITPANLSALNTTFVGDWRKGYQAAIDTAWWAKIAMKVNSTTSQNDYGWVGDIPKVREWIGERIVRDLSAHSYTIKNRKFELTLGIPQDKIEDDELGIYSTIAQGHGQAFGYHPNELILEVLEGNPECFDGQPFFDTDHPVDPHDASKGVYTNLYTSQALNQANFLETYGAMGALVSEDGKPLGVRGMLLVVPTALHATAKTIVEAQIVGGDSNITFGMAQILVIPELTSATTWYLMDTSRLIKPFIFQERKAPTIVAKDQDADEDVLKYGEHRLYGTSRGNAGVSLPFLASKNTQ